MKKTTSRVNKAMRETVDIDGLADKIFAKYLKYVQTKAQSPAASIIPAPNPVQPAPINANPEE